MVVKYICLKIRRRRRAVGGDGEIHHVAFRVKNREALNQWQQRLEASGLRHFGLCKSLLF